MTLEVLPSKNNKVLKKKARILKEDYCRPFFQKKKKNVFWNQNQIAPTRTFKNNVTLKIYRLILKINCKSSYIIYLIECSKCKIQFTVKLNDRRKDFTRKNSIPASNHFNFEGEVFNRHVKFIIIEQLNQIDLDKLMLWKWLKVRGNFWSQMLGALHPKDLNRELNTIL